MGFVKQPEIIVSQEYRKSKNSFRENFSFYKVSGSLSGKGGVGLGDLQSPFSSNLFEDWGRSWKSDGLPGGDGGLNFLPLTTGTQFLLCCQETVQGQEGEAHGRDDSMPQK